MSCGFYNMHRKNVAQRRNRSALEKGPDIPGSGLRGGGKAGICTLTRRAATEWEGRKRPQEEEEGQQNSKRQFRKHFFAER